MQVTETLSEGLKRGYSIVVPSDDIESRLVSKLTQLSTQIRMPGFRPGKVPLNLLRKMHGKNVMGEVLEEMVNEATTKALTDNDLRPALQPKVEITKFEEGADLEYTVELEVMPEFEAMDFATLSLEKMTVEVDEAMVDERLSSLAGQFKNYVDAEEGHAAEDGNTVNINFLGKIDGVAFDGGKGENYDLVLGSGQFIPGFEDQLLGLKAGDETVVKVAFPESYGAEELAGKDAEFEVKVNAVKVAEEDAIDDEFAKKLGMESLEDVKNALRDQVSGEYGNIARQHLKRSLLDKLADAHDFEVPQGMVDAEFEQIWQQVMEDLNRQGKSVEDLDKGEEESKDEYRAIAERRVRLGLLLSDVGNKNKLEVTQDEINRAIAQQAQQFPGQEAQVFQFYQQNAEAQAQLRAPIMEDKVIDFIVEMAKVEERTVSLDELLRDPDAEEGDAAAEIAEAKPKKKAAAKKATAKKKAVAKKSTAKKKTAAKKAAAKAKDADS